MTMILYHCTTREDAASILHESLNIGCASILPTTSERVLYCDHVERDGESLFRLACDNDL